MIIRAAICLGVLIHFGIPAAATSITYASSPAAPFSSPREEQRSARPTVDRWLIDASTTAGQNMIATIQLPVLLARKSNFEAAGHTLLAATPEPSPIF